MDWVEYGALGAPHGIRGEIKVWPARGGEVELTEGQRVRLLATAAQPARDLTIVSLRNADQAVLVRFQEITQREDLAALAKTRLAVNRDDLPPLESGEYYYYELVGCEVQDEAGRSLGVAQQLLDNSSQCLLQILAEDGEQHLLPLVPQIRLRFDRAAQRVTVCVPEGLC